MGVLGFPKLESAQLLTNQAKTYHARLFARRLQYLYLLLSCPTGADLFESACPHKANIDFIEHSKGENPVRTNGTDMWWECQIGAIPGISPSLYVDGHDRTTV